MAILVRTLGLDIGKKRIGVAVSDDRGYIASPIATITYFDRDDAVAQILEIVGEYEILFCVIGFPRNMDGTVGEQGQFVYEFFECLNERLEIPCDLWDERLSTVAAEKMLISADLSRKKRKQVIDKAAAVVILQSYLDYNIISSNSGGTPAL